ncbi:hypothetical protein [Acinetobacter nosocomialis]|uniref:hypothetical protein n=1 Tax=Acinetobacter nosocomialis TaxID=106654 RepID=UPI00046E1229|nr:hypothetical protein [Acinetobacter nosocomialis]MDF0626420.1 hypothetical protein [Acinetobacter nosocomialis]RQL44381.1 hypothetical protein BJI56_18735 [Acinetobacter nosocomialis]
MAKLSIKASSQAPALIEFESGKEFDIRKYRPDLKVTGLRFVITAQHVRTLARLTFQGKKISKSLGTFSHADFDQNLEKLISQMQGFHQRIAQGLARKRKNCHQVLHVLLRRKLMIIQTMSGLWTLKMSLLICRIKMLKQRILLMKRRKILR